MILQSIYVLNKEIPPENPKFTIKSSFKSRGGYNGTCMVVNFWLNLILANQMVTLKVQSNNNGIQENDGFEEL